MTLHVNGQQTLNETVTDSVGLSAAFGAWQRRHNVQSDPGLPGLEVFKQEQLFFHSVGNMYCDKLSREQQDMINPKDVHAPDFARRLGALASSRAFKQNFNCKSKEPACELW